MPGDSRTFDKEHAAAQRQTESPIPIKSLYMDLMNPDLSSARQLEVSRLATQFIHRQLTEAARQPEDMPEELREAILADSPLALQTWILTGAQDAGRQYQAYLEGRKHDEPRHFFSCKSHALHFLLRVAPTKMVDGAWLSGLTRQWDDPRYASLINTYLEELGEGRSSDTSFATLQPLMAPTFLTHPSRQMHMQAKWLAPGQHHTTTGLAATRLYMAQTGMN